MGDMADFHLDEVIEQEHKRSLFHSGGMSEQEAYDNGFLGVAGDLEAFAGNYSDYADVPSIDSIDAQLFQAEALLDSGGISYSDLFRLSVGNTIPTYRMSKDEQHTYFVKILQKKYSDSFIKQIMNELEDVGFLDLQKGSSTKEHIKTLTAELAKNYKAGYEGLDYILSVTSGAVLTGSFGVNKSVVHYAKTRKNPTCNICEKEMLSKHGKYGKFYYCENRCEGQPTVSDNYWQKFKEKVR